MQAGRERNTQRKLESLLADQTELQRMTFDSIQVPESKYSHQGPHELLLLLLVAQVAVPEYDRRNIMTVSRELAI